MQTQKSHVRDSAASKDHIIDFKQTFEHSAIGMAIVSLDGNWLEVNEAICKIVGYSREELQEIDFQTITHPEDLAKDVEFLTKLLDNEINSYQMDKRYFNKNGNVIWVQLDVSLVYDNNKKPLYFISQIQDISQRKLTEKQLSKSLEEQGHLNKKLQESYDNMEQKVVERTTNLQDLINALQEEIKKHKETQQDLEDTEKKYEDLYNNAPDMYASIDPVTKKIIQCNNTLSQATGYTKNEIIGMDIFDFYHPDCHVDVNEALNQFLTTGEVKNKELQLKKKDGARIDVSLNVSAIRDKEGEIIKSRSSWRDISQQKRLEKELQKTIDDLSKKSRFEKIIRNISQSIHNSIDFQIVLENTVESLVENIKGIANACVYIIEDNVACIKAHRGLPNWYIEKAGEIDYPKGFTWRTIIDNKITYCEDVESDKTIGAAGRRLGTKSYIGLPINIEGSTIGVLILHSLNKKAFGNETITLLQVIVQQIEVAFSNAKKANDLVISQQKLKQINESLEQKVKERTRELEKYTEELKNSNKDLEQFAYVASHDLQEPLRKIKSFTELLASKYKGNLDEKADDYIEYVVDGASRMQKLISDLLSYSRVGKEENKKCEVDLNNTVENVIESLELSIKESDTKIKCYKLPTVYTNDNDIFRVLLNLMNNAIKFKKANTNPIINIGYSEEDTKYILYVSDNGIGVEEEYLPRIFGIFERLHSKADYPGTGIGLAICKKIIEKNGGKIWAESKKGVGTKFLFSIPKEKTIAA